MNTQIRDYLLLESSDKKHFKIHKDYIKISGLLSTMFEEDPGEYIFPLNIPSNVLQQIVIFMNYHKGTDCFIPIKPIQSNNINQIIQDDWDVNYVNNLIDNKLIKNVLQASNYLDMEGLLHICCAKVASMIRGIDYHNMTNILENI